MSAVAQNQADLAGFGIVLDEHAKELRRGLWFGGRPARVVRLSGAGADALDRLRGGEVVRTAAEGTVARRLVDAGLAHPVPPKATTPSTPSTPTGITVIVPVRDRPEALDRCLASFGRRLPVVVVDDGSRNPLAVHAIAARHHARVVRLEVNAGPAAARNAGLAAATSDLVAFADSDTEPGVDWLTDLAGHFADPTVAAVAPRIRPRSDSSLAGRYTRCRGTLDLGGARGRVIPYTAVSYVPTAALLARRSTLLAVARDGDVFDAAMRVGEDVDLIWRLVAAGHTVRYEPSSGVAHDEPRTWRELLGRRFRYGTSAAALAERHPGNVAPLVVHPWFSTAVVALLAERPLVALAATAVAAQRMRTSLQRVDVPTSGLGRATATAVGQTFLGTARFATQVGWPMLLAGLVHRRTRLPAAALLAVPALEAWRRTDRRVDPLRFTAAALVDDAAYGAGVVTGCLLRRTTAPLRPIRAR